MLTDFDDFATWMYVLIDDSWHEIGQLYERSGPQPDCADAELITMAIVGACRAWAKDTNLRGEWATYRQLFPILPERSRFNRRRRNLMGAMHHIRRVALAVLDVAQDTQCVSDRLPIEVVTFHLVPSSTGEWDAHGAAFGRCTTKKRTIYGYRPNRCITVGGTILDFEVMSANADERAAARDLLESKRDVTVIGDKGVVTAALARELLERCNVRRLTLPRANQQQQVSPEVRRLGNQVRQIIEPLNGQLTEQFQIETNHAHSFWGLCARLYTKLTAHTLCMYLTRLLGNPDWVRITHLAFPSSF